MATMMKQLLQEQLAANDALAAESRRLKRKRQAKDEQGMCAICHMRRAVLIFFKCRHAYTCQQCFDHLLETKNAESEFVRCPMGREDVRSCARIFLQIS